MAPARPRPQARGVRSRPAGPLRALALAAALACPAAASARPAPAPDVNATKAEMVWNIAKFIQWPDTALATSNGQLVFTILGEDDLAASLATLLSSKLVNGKPVFVRFARRAQDARGSQILYVAASEQAHVDEVLGAVAGEPVLTVANAPGFAARGGMVGFAPGGDRVRFEINLGHAEKSGLRISAKLLALARVVDQTP